jgi:hypothetical protein
MSAMTGLARIGTSEKLGFVVTARCNKIQKVGETLIL